MSLTLSITAKFYNGKTATVYGYHNPTNMDSEVFKYPDEIKISDVHLTNKRVKHYKVNLTGFTSRTGEYLVSDSQTLPKIESALFVLNSKIRFLKALK